MLAMASFKSIDAVQQKSLRKYKRASNLKANLIFFDSTTTPAEKPPKIDAYDSTFTLSLQQSNTTRSSPSTNRRSLFINLGLPTLFVILPLTLLAAVLVGLVLYGWKRIGQQSLFANETLSPPAESGFILVNISNSWLLSLSSVSSTVAGLMAPSVMMIQMYLNAQAMQDNSLAAQNALGNTRNLPTPYQISLMLGLSSGNPERLWRFEKYSRNTSNEVPPMMRRTALILKLCLVLSLAMFVADQSLHYTTTTVQIDQATAIETVSSFGRGLTQECLSMSREQNYWEPCSMDFNLDTFQRETAQNQMFFLQQGTSDVSSIEVVDAVRQPETDMAMLFAADVQSNLDYRTSTIGVSAQCVPISSECAMNKSGATGSYTSFNCSENFWGILNKDPASSTNISFVDPDVPPLAFKWSKNLQIAFFMDEALKIPYNSLGLDPFTGQSDLSKPGLLDAELINPVYFGIAGSFSASQQLAGVNLGTDPEISTGADYLSFVLRCSYRTFEVEYTSHGGRLGNFDTTPTKNGSIAEIYHGYISQLSLGGSDTNTQLQNILSTAVLEPNAANLADKWAQQHSKQILSVIGAFTSPRGNFEEQSRKSILVTKLPIPALAVLLTLNLTYLPFGLCLFGMAYRTASRTEIHDLFARLSVPGVITSFFDTDGTTSASNGTSCCGFDESKIVQEATHVEAVLNEKEEYRLQPAWHRV